MWRNELGEVNVGDIISGIYYDARMKILTKETWHDHFKYTAKYIEGIDKDKVETVYSFAAYNKVNK